MTVREYRIIHVIFILIIISIYAYIYTLPIHKLHIPCSIKTITGKTCATCGTTRVFQHILSGDISKATGLNLISCFIVLFTVLQLGLRIILLYLSHKKNISLTQIVTIDIIASGILFITCFTPYITRQA